MIRVIRQLENSKKLNQLKILFLLIMEFVWLRATSSDQIDMAGSHTLEIIPEDNRIEKKSRIIEIKSNRSSWHYYMVHKEVRRGSAQAPTITFWILPRISKFFHLHNALSYRIPSRNRHLYNHKNRHLCWVDMMSQSKPRFKMLHILKMLKNTQIWTWQQRGHSILVDGRIYLLQGIQ